VRPSPLRIGLAASDQPAETHDPVTVATKLKESASAEFDEMKRAMRTNALGQSGT